MINYWFNSSVFPVLVLGSLVLVCESLDIVNFTSLTLSILTLSTPTKFTVGTLVYSPASVYSETSNSAAKFASVRLFNTSA